MTTEIHVLHVVDSLGKGGLENGLVNLISGLDSRRFRHTVCALRTLGANAQQMPRDRVEVLCLNRKDTDPAIQIPEIVRTIREVRPHIVHSRNFGTIEAVIAGRWTRNCAIVHSEHGLESDTGARPPWRRVVLRRLAYEMADRVLSVSRELGDLHARHTGFSRDRIGVIHNGVNDRRFFPDASARQRLRAQMNIEPGTICIGCVGNLFPVKDHMTLLKSAAALTGPDWRLLIAGAGPELNPLQSFVNGNPLLNRRVSFLGAVSHVPELLNAMDVYVLPSLAEGISNSLLEAMSTGLPVVATETGGNPEVVVDGRSGLLFPVRDAAKLTEHLRMLCGHSGMRQKLGAQALQRARGQFSIESMIRNYEQLYESLAPTSPALPAALGA